ncbi:MAG: M15 family metallopeptidase [Jiangellales bacterium]
MSQLRNLRVQYRDYNGRVRTGTVVVRADAVDAVRTVFRRAYEQRFPFKLVKPLEGYYAGGARSPHDSDVAAMNAGNTGAFNCRPVVGNPYRTSQHSYGNAIDYNTIQNPYVTASRVYPTAGRAYLNRSRYQAGMILPGSVVATTMASRGWPWGARWAYPDYQHFSSNGG